MGRNAQRRRDVKDAPKALPTTERGTMNRLRRRMQEVTTRQQFEEMLAQAPEDQRDRMRALLEPMLRPELPCCGVNQLAVAMGEPRARLQHGTKCPVRLVEFAS